MFEREQKYNLLKEAQPLGITPGGALENMSQELAGAIPTLKGYCDDETAQEIIKDSMRGMIMLAWGIFFSEMSDQVDSFLDPNDLELEYQEFIEELHSFFPREQHEFNEIIKNFASTTQLNLIEQLSMALMSPIEMIFNSMVPDKVKEFLQNKIVSGIMNISVGIGKIVSGVGMCATIAGAIGGVPLIILGANNAINGIQDIWHALRGEWDAGSVDLLKEATGHQFDHTFTLIDFATTIGTAKTTSNLGKSVVSKVKGQLGEAFGQAGRTFGEAASTLSTAARAARNAARAFCREKVLNLLNSIPQRAFGRQLAYAGYPVNPVMLAEKFNEGSQFVRKMARKAKGGANKLKDVGKKGTEAVSKGLKLKKASPYDLIPTHSLTKGHIKMQKFIDEIKNNGIKDTVKYIEHNGSKYIVDGHHRIAAAKRLGIKEIPIEKVELPFAGYKTIDDLMWFD